MRKSQPIYLAYVGTTKVAFLKAHVTNSGHPEVEALSARIAQGFDRGIVKDLREASQTISDAVREVVGTNSQEILSCRLVVSNSFLKTYTFQSSIYFHGDPHPITLRDVRQAIAQTRSVATIPLNEVIVQVVPQEFLVNDLAGVQNPIGLEAGRLGVTLKLLTLNFLDYSNLFKVFERCELEILEVVPAVLASADAVLLAEEKQAGAILVLIGGQATHFACYRNSVLIHVHSIPVGADCITEVIEKNLNLDHLDAQRIKEAFGSAIPKAEFQDELIPIPDAEGKKKNHIRRRDFESQLGSGLHQFFQVLSHELACLEKQYSPVSQLVCTGGGSQLDGFLDRMKELISPTVRIGYPIGFKGPGGLSTNPGFAAALGGIKFTSKIREDHLPAAEKQHWLLRSAGVVRDWVFEYF